MILIFGFALLAIAAWQMRYPIWTGGFFMLLLFFFPPVTYCLIAVGLYLQFIRPLFAR